jgi:hypothetical protein
MTLLVLDPGRVTLLAVGLLAYAALMVPLLAKGAGFATASVTASCSHGGWSEVRKLDGEVCNSRHTLPRAMIVGVIRATVAFISTSLEFVYVAPT